MKFNNPAFYAAIGHKVSQALHDGGIVNVAAISQDLRRQTPSENIYDIERAVLGYANLIGAPVLFERGLSYGFEEPGCEGRGALFIEFVEGNPDTLND